MNGEPGRIVSSGMGGFLNPPGHPEHFFSVEHGTPRTGQGCMCLSSAVTSEWLDSQVRQKALNLLFAWHNHRLALESEPVQSWIRQILGYFHDCYQGWGRTPEETWNVDRLLVDRTIDPMSWADLHAGVHFIRKFYPEFVPTAEQFQKARWGGEKLPME